MKKIKWFFIISCIVFSKIQAEAVRVHLTAEQVEAANKFGREYKNGSQEKLKQI